MAPFRSKVGMNRSALPLVLGVWGRAKMWRMARSLSAVAQRRER